MSKYSNKGSIVAQNNNTYNDKCKFHSKLGCTLNLGTCAHAHAPPTITVIITKK